MSIRLLLDARKIFDGGIGVYTQNIIESLITTGGDIKLTLLINPEQKQKIQEAGFFWFNQTDWREDPAKVLSFDEYFNLTRRVDFKEFDIYHTPFITLPFNLPIPGVITIHDLIQVTHPEKFYYPAMAKVIIGDAIRRARGVLTVSQSSAALIKKTFSQIKSEKLTVIPNVLGSSFVNSEKIDFAATFPQLAGKKFIMALYSNLKPHKGCRDLVEVFCGLIESQQLPEDFHLLIVGKGLSEITDPETLKVINRCPQLIKLGEVNDAELVGLLTAADALVVSSLVEGFSLPVLQAHSQGTRVITRPIPAIQELLSPGDVAAKDFSRQALGEAILDFYQNPDSRKRQYDLSNYDLLALSDKLTHYYKEILANESSIST